MTTNRANVFGSLIYTYNEKIKPITNKTFTRTLRADSSKLLLEAKIFSIKPLFCLSTGIEILITSPDE